MRTIRYSLVFCLWIAFIGNINAQTTSSIAFLEISPNGNFIAGAGIDIIRVWDSSTGNLLWEVPQNAFVLDLSWSPDSTRLVTVTAGGFARVWNISQASSPMGTLLADFQPDFVVFETIDWSPDGQYLAIGGLFNQPRLQLWNAITYQFVTELPLGVNISNIEWNPDIQRNLFAAYFNQDYGVLLVSGDPNQTPIIACQDCTLGEWTPDVQWNNSGTRLAIVTSREDSNSLIQIVDIETNQLTLTIQSSAYINAIAWNADGTLIASTTYDGTSFMIEIWDAATGELLATGPESHLVGFNPNNDDLIYLDSLNPEQAIILPIIELIPSYNDDISNNELNIQGVED
jgi:WD40 repeat protein